MQDSKHTPISTVVVMSSDWVQRELLRLLLEDRGHAVLEAVDSVDVLDVMEEAGSRLIVVLDVTAEDVTALEVLREAKHDLAMCYRHFYVLLAPPNQPLPCDVWPLIDALAISVLCKPLDLDELFAVVGRLSKCLHGSLTGADSLSL